jgi:hypothetical protein
MTPISFSYESRDYDNFARFLDHNSGRPATPLSRLGYPIGSIISGGLGVLIWFVGQSFIGGILGAVLITLAAVLAIVTSSVAVWIWARRLIGRRNLAALPEQTIAATESGLSWSSGMAVIDVPWASVLELNHDASCIYFQTDGMWRILPNRAFASAEAAARFYERAVAYVAMVEPKPLTKPAPPPVDPSTWPPPPL